MVLIILVIIFYAYDTKTDYLLYLDPHIVTNYNQNVTLNFLSAKNHSIAYIKELNPSITFCFYYQDYETFMELKKFLEANTIFNILHKVIYKGNKSNNYNNNDKKDSEWEMI